jgi:hypothetical protein
MTSSELLFFALMVFSAIVVTFRLYLVVKGEYPAWERRRVNLPGYERRRKGDLGYSWWWML